MSRSFGRRVPAAAASVALAVLPAVAGGNGAHSSSPPLHPATLRALSAAVAGAQSRLQRPRCQRVFSDFADAAGVSLAEKLRALGRTGGEHLATLSFAEGSARRGCRASDVLAITSPGSPLVLVCGSRFRVWQQLDPPLVEAIVIHEVLHTLGLGENPPRSSDITRRVLRRCGG